MKNKLLKDIKHLAIEWKISDFLRNFAAVVLGIVITFVGSDIIEEHKKEKDISKAMQLIKEELLINQEQIKEMMNTEVFEKNGALYLLQYKDSLNKATPDSLQKYHGFAFQTRAFLPVTEAMDMLQSSSLMQYINNKELIIQIIKAYNVIKGSYGTFEQYTEMKEKRTETLTNNYEIQDFLSKETNILQRFEFLFSHVEGLTYIQQISYMHDNPSRMYGRHLEFITQTISAIDKEYN